MPERVGTARASDGQWKARGVGRQLAQRLASVGCWMVGSGTSSTRMSRFPCQVTTRMRGTCPGLLYVCVVAGSTTALPVRVRRMITGE